MPSTTQFIISVPPIFCLRARYKVPSAEEKNNFTIISRTNVACELRAYVGTAMSVSWQKFTFI